jgi:hypothetical protein
MNIKKSEGSYKLIILIVILIIIVGGLIYYKTFSNNKTAKDSFVNYSEYSKKYILQDCMDGWGKEYVTNNSGDTRSLHDICMNNTYLSDPKLLCGICGTDNNPLFSMTSSSDPNKKYYGCAPNSQNSISINWGDSGTAINKLLSDRMTCDTFNNGAKSGMYIYVCSDSTCNILLNGSVVHTHKGINIGEYFIDNVSYSDTLTLVCKGQSIIENFEQGFGQNLIKNIVDKSSSNSSKNIEKNSEQHTGLCFSYIWNKQIFILENNGYQNCANTIYYTTEGKIKWDNIWTKQSVGLLPWMKNWIRSTDGSNSTVSINTFVGSTKNVELMNNDCVIFGSVTYAGDNSFISQTQVTSASGLESRTVNSGNKELFSNSNYKKKLENKYYEYKIDNVIEGDSFVLNGIYRNSDNFADNNANKLNYTTCYLWCGRIFCFPRGDNFDKIVNIISLKSTWYGFVDTEYNLIDRDPNDKNILFFQKKLLTPTDNYGYKLIFTINNTPIDLEKIKK